MTSFVCAVIVPPRILALTAAISWSASAVAGTTAARATPPPGRHGVRPPSGGRLVVHEPLARLPADVVHRGGLIGEPREQSNPFVHSVAGGIRDAHDDLIALVMRPAVELEGRTLLRSLDA